MAPLPELPTTDLTGYREVVAWTGFATSLVALVLASGIFVVTWFTGRRKRDGRNGGVEWYYPEEKDRLHSMGILASIAILMLYVVMLIGQGATTRADGITVLYARPILQGVAFLALTVALAVFLGLGTDEENTRNMWSVYAYPLCWALLYFVALTMMTISVASNSLVWFVAAILVCTPFYVWNFLNSNRRPGLTAFGVLGVAAILWLAYGIVFLISPGTLNQINGTVMVWLFWATEVSTLLLIIVLPFFGIPEFPTNTNGPIATSENRKLNGLASRAAAPLLTVVNRTVAAGAAAAGVANPLNKVKSQMQPTLRVARPAGGAGYATRSTYRQEEQQEA